MPELSTLKFTYHDPCSLGRYCNIYDKPRNILKTIPNLKLIEMYRNRENSWCCGAGGAGEVKTAYPEFANWTAQDRIKEAKAVGANAIVTSCPFCKSTLKQASSDIEIFDLTELVASVIS